MRMFLDQFILHDHEFCNARDKDWNIILNMMVFIFAVCLNTADPAEMINHLLRIFYGHIIALGNLFQIQICSGLFECQEHLRFFFCQHFIQAPYLWIIRLDGMRQLGCISVGDHAGELNQDLFFFWIWCNVVRIQLVVARIGHSVLLFVHVSSPLSMS